MIIATCNIDNLLLLRILTYKGTKSKVLARHGTNKPKLLFLTKLELD
jgi:hypothetical protein